MPEYDNTDEDLLLAYYAGDDIALNALMERHYDMTQRVARRRVSSDEDAEDVAMEGWGDIAASRYHLSSQWTKAKNGPILRWIISIVINKAIDHVRRRDAQRRLGTGKDVQINAGRGNTEEDFVEFYVGRSPDPMEIVTSAGNVDDFRHTLTAQEIVYLDLTVDFAYTNGETADVLGISDSRATALKKQVQRKWQAHCVEQERHILQHGGR